MKTNEPRRIFTEAPLFPDFQFIYKKPTTQNPINKQKKTTLPNKRTPHMEILVNLSDFNSRLSI